MMSEFFVLSILNTQSTTFTEMENKVGYLWEGLFSASQVIHNFFFLVCITIMLIIVNSSSLIKYLQPRFGIGTEAMFADLGHFNVRAIQVYLMQLRASLLSTSDTSSLVLNYIYRQASVVFCSQQYHLLTLGKLRILRNMVIMSATLSTNQFQVTVNCNLTEYIILLSA